MKQNLYVHDDKLNAEITKVLHEYNSLTIESLFLNINKEKVNEAICKTLNGSDGFGINHRTAAAVIKGEVKTIIVLDVGVIDSRFPHVTDMVTISILDLEYTTEQATNIAEEIVNTKECLFNELKRNESWFDREDAENKIKECVDKLKRLMN